MTGVILLAPPEQAALLFGLLVDLARRRVVVRCGYRAGLLRETSRPLTALRFSQGLVNIKHAFPQVSLRRRQQVRTKRCRPCSDSARVYKRHVTVIVEG